MMIRIERDLVSRVAMVIMCFTAIACTQMAHATGRSNSADEDVMRAQGISVKLPFLNAGFEVITEGTNNYPVKRQLSSYLPFDQDLTLIYLVGYSADKLIIKIADDGDTGDRLLGYAQASNGNVAWGTLYSSGTQSSFEMTIPTFDTGVFVLLYSGFIAPSVDEQDLYGYTITLSYPQ